MERPTNDEAVGPDAGVATAIFGHSDAPALFQLVRPRNSWHRIGRSERRDQSGEIQPRDHRKYWERVLLRLIVDGVAFKLELS